jgi:hypothetical protein
LHFATGGNAPLVNNTIAGHKLRGFFVVLVSLTALLIAVKFLRFSL